MTTGPALVCINALMIYFRDTLSSADPIRVMTVSTSLGAMIAFPRNILVIFFMISVDVSYKDMQDQSITVKSVKMNKRRGKSKYGRKKMCYLLR